MAQGDSLKEEIAKLQKLLEEADNKLLVQKESHQKIVNEMTQMEKEREDVGQKLKQNETLIEQKRKQLTEVKNNQFKESLVQDYVEEVDFVDREGWRKGSEDSSEEETETEPNESYEPTNILD